MGIAKEINNPLAVILGRLELMAALGYGDPQVTARHLGVVTDHAQRIAEFVDNLNVLARAGAGHREEMSLLAVLDEAQDGCRRRLGRVQVLRMLDPPELTIWANPEQLSQALRVLFFACGDAMRGRGRLEIRARPEGSQCAVEFLGSALTSVAAHLADLEEARDEAAALSTPISLALAATILADQGGLLEPARRPPPPPRPRGGNISILQKTWIIKLTINIYG